MIELAKLNGSGQVLIVCAFREPPLSNDRGGFLCGVGGVCEEE